MSEGERESPKNNIFGFFHFEFLKYLYKNVGVVEKSRIDDKNCLNFHRNY